jgi:Polyketide cyclase / dehydrase and lipid transport
MTEPAARSFATRTEEEQVMAAIYKEIEISVPSADAWAAIRDYGAIGRIVPQIECRMDGDARIITFPDGRVARELLVGIDDEHRRLVYAEPGGRFITRNGAMQVVEISDGRCRLVWTNDLLPDEFAAMVAGNMDRGLATMKQSLEAGARAH